MRAKARVNEYSLQLITCNIALHSAQQVESGNLVNGTSIFDKNAVTYLN